MQIVSCSPVGWRLSPPCAERAWFVHVIKGHPCLRYCCSSLAPARFLRVWSNASTSFSSQALDGWKPSPPSWLDASEAEDAQEHEHLYTACEGLGGVMMEWSVAFLDRLFEVLRHKGIVFF